MSDSAAPKSWFRELIMIAPHDGAHRAAIRAGVSMGVPLLALSVLGHTGLSLFAAIGAFTSVFGRAETHRDRLHMQASLGVLLVASVLIGSLIGSMSSRTWIVIPVATLSAGVITVVSEMEGWKPAGPLYPVYALVASSASVSSQTSVWMTVVVAASSAAFAVAVGSAQALLTMAARRADHPSMVRSRVVTRSMRPSP